MPTKIKLPPKMKRLLVWLGAGAAVSGLALMAGPNNSTNDRDKDKTVKHVLTDFNTRELGVDSLASGIKLLHAREDALRREIASIHKEMELLKKSAGLIAQGRDPGLESRLKTADELISELKLIRSLLPKNLRVNRLEAKDANINKEGFTVKGFSGEERSIKSQVETNNTPKNTSNANINHKAHAQATLATNGGPEKSLWSDEGATRLNLLEADLEANQAHIISIRAPNVNSLENDKGRGEGKAKAIGQDQAAPNATSYKEQSKAQLEQEAHGSIKDQTRIKEERMAPDALGLYIPAGSIISGYLVTGLDAPTSEKAKTEPFPVLIAIDKSTLLPNNFRADLKECMVLAAAYGDMSSERVYMRAESLNCIMDSGRSFELELSGYAAGSDGKAGLRGRLVSRQGRLIARSLTAGFLEGLAGAFDVNPVPTINTTGTGRVEYDSVYSSRALTGASIKGTSKALERIADFYMRLADNMFPFLEIDASRRVDLILTQGAGAPGLLHPTHHRYQTFE